MKIYVAGPMRGIPEFNFPAFFKATSQLREAGHDVFCPAEHDVQGGFHPTGLTGDEDLAKLGFDHRDALAQDIDWILREAEAVCVLPGWKHSLGATAEVAAAKAIGLKVDSIGGFLS